MRVVDSEAPSNPLRIVAIVGLISLAADAYYAIAQHRFDVFTLLRLLLWLTFLFFYARRARWAWHVIVAEGPLFFCLYWALYFLGDLSHQPYFRTISSLRIVFFIHLLIVAGLLIWLIRIRERYFLYIREAVSEKT